MSLFEQLLYKELMMKKILISASLLALMITPTAKADPFKGMFGGAQLGWGQIKLTDKGSPLVKGTSFDLKARGTENTIPFGFHFGMASYSTGNIYLAGELGMDFFIKSTAKIFAPYIDGKLGYRVHERIVAYGSLGAALGIFRVDTRAGDNKSSNEFGFRPGAGVMFAMNDKITVGVQYNYSRYSNVSYKATIGGNTVRAKFRPETHAVMARMSYALG